VIENVSVVQRHHAGSLSAQIGNRDVSCDIGTQPSEARIHQATGFILLVCQKGQHFLARGFVEQRQKLFAIFRPGFLDQVGCIVGREYAEPDVALLLGKAEHDKDLVMRTQGKEEICFLARMH